MRPSRGSPWYCSTELHRRGDWLIFPTQNLFFCRLSGRVQCPAGGARETGLISALPSPAPEAGVGGRRKERGERREERGERREEKEERRRERGERREERGERREERGGEREERGERRGRRGEGEAET